MTYYNAFQLIAYRVPTDRPLGAGKECPTHLLNNYKADLPSSPDAYRRLMRILAVADLARLSIERKTYDNTLKVFVAPEFYFRPEKSDTAARSYSKEDKDRIISALAHAFNTKEFKSWLLVLGTIVWAAKAEDVLKRKGIVDTGGPKLNAAKRSVVWNTAIVIEGGTDNMATFNKENYDGADVIDSQYRPGTHSGSSFDKLSEKNKNTLADYFNQIKSDSRSNLIMKVGDNLHFGIEVCADHAFGVLKDAYATHRQKLDKNKAPVPKLDFQILTACGMPVQPEHLVIGANQCILRVDGNPNCFPSTGNLEPSEIERVVSVDVAGNKTLCTEYSQHQNEWKSLNKPPALSIALGTDSNSPLKVPTDSAGTASRYAFGSAEPVEKPLDEAYPQCVVIHRPVSFGDEQAQDA